MCSSSTSSEKARSFFSRTKSNAPPSPDLRRDASSSPGAHFTAVLVAGQCSHFLTSAGATWARNQALSSRNFPQVWLSVWPRVNISKYFLVAILSEPLHFPMLPDKSCFDEYLNENREPVCNLDWWLETFPPPNAAVDQVDWDWQLMGALGITYRVRSMQIISPERRIYYVIVQCTKPLSPYVWSEWCGEASRSRLVRNCGTVRPFSKGHSVIVDSFFMPLKPPGFSEQCLFHETKLY